MTKKKQNKPKIRGAKLASPPADSLLTPINIEINGYVYTCYGNSRVESIVDSVESHIDNDREFKDNITVIQNGYINEVVYAPAVLCMLGYFDKGDLYNILIGQTAEEFLDGSEEQE